MKTQLYLFTLAALLGMAACGTKESGEEKEPEKPTDKTTYTVTYSYEIGSSKNKVTQTIESGTMAVPLLSGMFVTTRRHERAGRAVICNAARNMEQFVIAWWVEK